MSRSYGACGPTPDASSKQQSSQGARNPTMRHARKWTNSSVRRLAGGANPVQMITDRARDVVCRAMDEGWSGPPFDPLGIADFLKLKVIPTDDVREARTVPCGDSFQIEYNPNRPRGRMRYSLAHEIAHTLFPDAAEQVRHRATRNELTGDEWQLEALCNIGAAEILMPIGTLPDFSAPALTIDNLMNLQRQFDVSTEALFIRAASVTSVACVVFCASRVEAGPNRSKYRLNYLIPSRTSSWTLDRHFLIGSDSVVMQCNAIGFTAKGRETWDPNSGEPDYVECVGIPPFPGSAYPRVVGIATRPGTAVQSDGIVYLRGDVTQPRGNGRRVIVHVVNNRARSWGGRGVAVAIANAWPAAHKDYKHWISSSSDARTLGSLRLFSVTEEDSVASLVCQSGYGESAKPRIRYAALRECLEELGVGLQRLHASVHMPRIGCGQAGGTWDVVEEMVISSLCRREIPVTVYDPPGRDLPKRAQDSFNFSLTPN